MNGSSTEVECFRVESILWPKTAQVAANIPPVNNLALCVTESRHRDIPVSSCLHKIIGLKAKNTLDSKIFD